MENAVFILGAGFNADARRHINTIDEIVSYPMVDDLASKCFGLATIPRGTSIERLFQNAIDNRERAPLDNLCLSLMKADYYLSDPVAHGEKETPFYREFLQAFPDSNFISFNYDAFLEILLLRSKEWRPDDGFGLPVRVEQSTSPANHGIPDRSRRLVVHLHGSLYVYTQEYQFSPPDQAGTRWMNSLQEPVFLFDPDSAAHRFYPFQRVQPELHYEFVYDRIIAPVPNKASALKNAFVRKSFENAIGFLSSADLVIAIGYRFNPADEASYVQLLSTLREQRKTLRVVTPDAREITTRLTTQFQIECEPIQCRFTDWARTGFLT